MHVRLTAQWLLAALSAATAAVMLAQPALATPQPEPCPGGNGAQYQSIEGGVYYWKLMAPKGVTIKGLVDGKVYTFDGYDYAGSSGNLAVRLRDTLTQADIRDLISKGWKFSSRVISRDWDTEEFGPPPGKGMTVERLRLGAEQNAQDEFYGRAVSEKLYPYSWQNAIGKKVSWRAEAMKEAKKLNRNQQENNAPRGEGKDDGDTLNTGSEDAAGLAWAALWGGDKEDPGSPQGVRDPGLVRHGAVSARVHIVTARRPGLRGAARTAGRHTGMESVRVVA
jgi:hypothetical protein